MKASRNVIVVCGEASAARFEGSVLSHLTKPLEVVTAFTKAELFERIEEQQPLLCLIEHEIPSISAADQLKELFAGTGIDLSDTAGDQTWSLGSGSTAREIIPDLLRASPDTRFVVTCHIRHSGMGNAECNRYKQLNCVERVVGFINSPTNAAELIKLISKAYFGERWTPELLADARNQGGNSRIALDNQPKDVFARKNNDIPVFHVANDKVYFMKSPLRGARPETFQRLLGPWARDRERIYYTSRVCRNADVASFEVSNIIYGRDKQSVYIRGWAIKSADPKTFKVLDAGVDGQSDIWRIYHPQVGYSRDAKIVFFGHKPVKDADPNTFTSLGNQFGRDREHVYFGDRKIKGADLRTWRHWCGELSLDASHVYYETRPIDGVDRKSVKALAYQNAFLDRNRIYVCGKAVPTEEFLKRIKHTLELVTMQRDAIASGKAFEQQLLEWPNTY